MNSRPRLRARIQASESTQLVRQGCFFLQYSLKTSTTNWVHRLVIFCICWDTPSEKTVIWQLSKVSSAFILGYVNVAKLIAMLETVFFYVKPFYQETNWRIKGGYLDRLKWHLPVHMCYPLLLHWIHCQYTHHLEPIGLQIHHV